MCGRFVSESPPDEIARYFAAEDITPSALQPSWNVAPTDDIYVVYARGGARRLDAVRWGLVPPWAKDLSVGSRMINARAESLDRNGAFKPAFARRRCLIPADGFYEWKAVPGQKKKQPMFIHRRDGEPYALAGLWETWRPRVALTTGGARSPKRSVGESLLSATIVTTNASEAMLGVHDRMPVILAPSAWDAWLDQDNTDLDALGRLLVPAPAALTVMRPVAPDVSNVRSNGPHLTDAIDANAPRGPNADGAQATLL